jgi:hypothetical protein
MKRTITIIFIIIASLGLYWIYHESFFVKNNFIKYTGISEFIIESQYYDDSQSFIKVIVSTQGKQELLRKHHFESSTINMKGKVACPFIQYDNKDFVYFVDDKNKGQYGYILYCLKKDDNSLILYEYYGD